MFDFPSPRYLFKPDPHHILVDIDEAGADARFVAWDCMELGDSAYMNSFLHADKTGQKIHKVNAETIFAIPDGKKEPFYTNAKKGVHATSYGALPRTLRARCGMTMSQADNFQRRLFAAYPGIKLRIQEHEFLIQTGQPLRNKFGFESRFYERPEQCLPNALAWIPQSSTALVTYKAMRIIQTKFRDRITLLLQVHDSLVMQIPLRIHRATLRDLNEALHEIVVPYKIPLIIPWGLKTSETSWGAVRDASWSTFH